MTALDLRRRRRPVLATAGAAALLSAALFTACSKYDAPTAPPVAAPPAAPTQITAVYPTARSAGVFYDTPIWLQLASDPIASSVTETNVYFKLDTQRLPVTLAYDRATKRLSLTPRVPLELRRTYTVELTPRLLGADGRPVAPAGWFWQFQTNSLRRIVTPYPASGATWESPFVRLRWDSTEAVAGRVDYDVFVAADSAAVAARSVPVLARVNDADWIPHTRWGFDQTLYWSIRATNTATGERLEGPVWRFATLPLGLPVDTLIVAADQWGYASIFSGSGGCMGSTTLSGPSYRMGFHWKVPAGGDVLRFAGATFTQSISPDFKPSLQIQISGAAASWSACAGKTGGPPAADANSALATATAGSSADTYLMSSDFLTAYLEAEARGHDVYGYAITSSSTVFHFTTGTDLRHGALRLMVFRVPVPAAPARAARFGPPLDTAKRPASLSSVRNR